MNNDPQEPPKGDPINSFSPDLRDKNHPVVLIVVKPIDFDQLEKLIEVFVRSPRQATIRSRYSLVVRSRGVMCSYHFH